jgi:RES domain-containing protein
LTVGATLWRIAVDAPEYSADDLSGKGAEITGGRWNRKGRPVLYAARSVALACLETTVHLRQGGLPLNRYLVKLTVPEPAWKARETLDAATLPVGWDALPEGKVSLDIGEAWLAAGSSPLLEVPSVIVPEELNVLVNPLHPLAKGIAATKIRKWLYDPRLLGQRPA